jgi:hypothetical protein
MCIGNDQGHAENLRGRRCCKASVAPPDALRQRTGVFQKKSVAVRGGTLALGHPGAARGEREGGHGQSRNLHVFVNRAINQFHGGASIPCGALASGQTRNVAGLAPPSASQTLRAANNSKPAVGEKRRPVLLASSHPPGAADWRQQHHQRAHAPAAAKTASAGCCRRAIAGMNKAISRPWLPCSLPGRGMPLVGSNSPQVPSRGHLIY